jgi:hypothetical protein
MKEKPPGYIFGRPSNYEERFCEEMVNHFDIDKYKNKEIEVASGGRKVITTQIVANSFPTFEGFARKIGTTHRVLLEWSRKHEDFKKAYTICKEIQKEFLIEHGLLGGYNMAFAKFLAVNVTDLRDKAPEIEEKDILVFEE